MRNTVLNLEESLIREVANAGLGRDDVLAFWFGESDTATPLAVRQAAMDSTPRGETFHPHTLGLRALRQALADSMGRLHGAVGAERIAVTCGGVQALMLSGQALVGPGGGGAAGAPGGADCEGEAGDDGGGAALLAAAATTGGRLGAGCRRAAGGDHPGHAAAGAERAEQPDGLDAVCCRAARDSCPLPPDRLLDFGRRGVRAPVLRAERQRLRAEFSGSGAARRPADRGAQLFQELFDDGLAPGLAGHAAVDGPAYGQADRVQYFLCQRFHAAGRDGGLGTCRRDHAAGGGPSEALP